MPGVRSLQGRVALVVRAERGQGAAVALGLAARGASIVVVGEDERRLGEIVGEIACAGGKARHVVHAPLDAGTPGQVGPSASDVVAPGVRRAVETFGGLGVVIFVASPEDLRGGVLREMLRAASSSLPDDGVALVLGDHASRDELLSICSDAARSFAARGIPCNAVVRGAAFDDDRDERALVDLVVFLIGASGRAVSGQAILVRG